jgi:hypothetical protein
MSRPGSGFDHPTGVNRRQREFSDRTVIYYPNRQEPGLCSQTEIPASSNSSLSKLSSHPTVSILYTDANGAPSAHTDKNGYTVKYLQKISVPKDVFIKLSGK